jgi:hypothetical protein
MHLLDLPSELYDRISDRDAEDAPLDEIFRNRGVCFKSHSTLSLTHN